ncbi:protein VCF1 isoform X2 [Hoplias malabaricus]|uniref:protein VCF1 isoform X2 n=1 Tax=Hoplias malabaricus TaxID=27720 RepID=UPI003461A5E1
MLTENRKRRYRSDAEDVQHLPEAKRLVSQPSFTELGHDIWDSESSSSDSSGISSSDSVAGTSSISPLSDEKGKCILKDSCGGSSSCTSGHLAEEQNFSLIENDSSYSHINRILREAHFSSLQTRVQPGPT